MHPITSVCFVGTYRFLQIIRNIFFFDQRQNRPSNLLYVYSVYPMLTTSSSRKPEKAFPLTKTWNIKLIKLEKFSVVGDLSPTICIAINTIFKSL